MAIYRKFELYTKDENKTKNACSMPVKQCTKAALTGNNKLPK